MRPAGSPRRAARARGESMRWLRCAPTTPYTTRGMWQLDAARARARRVVPRVRAPRVRPAKLGVARACTARRPRSAGRSCPRGSPSCMPWQVVQVSSPRCAHARLQQPLVLVRGEPRGAVGPEARRERARSPCSVVSRQQRRRCSARGPRRHEGIAVREERARCRRRDALAVAAPADLRAALGRESRRVGDRRVGARRSGAARSGAAGRGCARRARSPGPVARLARDAELGDVRARSARSRLEARVRRDVVAEDAVVVPARDVAVVVGARGRARCRARSGSGVRNALVHVDEALLLARSTRSAGGRTRRDRARGIAGSGASRPCARPPRSSARARRRARNCITGRPRASRRSVAARRRIRARRASKSPSTACPARLLGHRAMKRACQLRCWPGWQLRQVLEPP